MALDPRVRAGLRRASASMPDPLQNVRVSSIITRGRRRRLVHRVRMAIVVLAAIIATAAVSPFVLREIRHWNTSEPATPQPPARATIATIAGNGLTVSSGDGGPAAQAAVPYPTDIDFDAAGNLYILEHAPPQHVRRVDPSGLITTVVGPGALGDAGTIDLSGIFGLTALAVDAEGNVYLAGGRGSITQTRVLRFDTSGNVTTVAGTGEPGVSGDGGPATEAKLRNMWDIDTDGEGNLYIGTAGRIRKVDTNGIITTIAGTGTKGFSGDGGQATEAQLSRLTGVTADIDGNVYFIDFGNDRIRRIDTDGIITTIAGPGRPGVCYSGDGGPATEADLCGPEHLAVGPDGAVYVADTYNDRIRTIDRNGIITTIAGNGTHTFSGDGVLATHAELSEPSGVAVGPDGSVYIADSGNNRVRRVVL
jgi:sugar lactone lactonase YvrE